MPEHLAALLRTLRDLGVADGPTLGTRLGLGQSSLSRLVSRAGGDVVRMGRTRGARYALPRSVAGLDNALPVYRVNEAGVAVESGVLRLLLNGAHWLERPQGRGTRFEGLPPFAVDMAPQGYLGRDFATQHADLSLPARLSDWNDEHRLIAIARRGEDCVGDLVLGRESLDRFLAAPPTPVTRADFAALARRGALGLVTAFIGGEQPKFSAFVEGRHCLVKFAGGETGAAAERWRDLLVCEHLALAVLARHAISASVSRWSDGEGFRFLEVERFDRVGARGRRGVVSLGALDGGHPGAGGTWTRQSSRLHHEGLITADDARRVRWLDVFGQLIGNTDRHPGNLSFFDDGEGQRRLCPVYDLLPMLYAPVQTTVVDRPFVPRPPTSETLDVWAHAASVAQTYWARVASCEDLSPAFRVLARRCGDAVGASRKAAGL